MVLVPHKAIGTFHQALDRTTLSTLAQLTTILISDEAILTVHHTHSTRLHAGWGRVTLTPLTTLSVLSKAMFTVHETVSGLTYRFGLWGTLTFVATVRIFGESMVTVHETHDWAAGYRRWRRLCAVTGRTTTAIPNATVLTVV